MKVFNALDGEDLPGSIQKCFVKVAKDANLCNNQLLLLVRLFRRNPLIGDWQFSFHELEKSLLLAKTHGPGVWRVVMLLCKHSLLHHKSKLFRTVLRYIGRLRATASASYQGNQRRFALFCYKHNYLPFPFRHTLIEAIQAGKLTWDHLEIYSSRVGLEFTHRPCNIFLEFD